MPAQQQHGPTLEVGSKFKQGRTTYEVTKVGPKMVEAKTSRGESRWFWKTTLEDAKAVA